MKVNRIHLHAINKVFRILQCLGLSLWKVTFMGSVHLSQKVNFSNVSFIFSIFIVFIVICAIITQYSKTLSGFDTTYTSSLSNTVRSIHRFTHYLHILAIFIPVWVLRKKMRRICEKLSQIKYILNDLNTNTAENFMMMRFAFQILIWIIYVIILTILEVTIGTSIASHRSLRDHGNTIGIRWETVFTFMVPPIFKNLCILHFIMLMSLMTTRMNQVQQLLERFM